MRKNMRQHFGLAAQPKADLHMPYVVDVRTGRKISLPGDVLQDGGDWYDEETHKGHIKCPDHNCPALVQYQAEIPFREGQEAPTRAHFKTRRGQTHNADCSVGTTTTQPAIDRKSRGYAVYLNADHLDGIAHPEARSKLLKNPYRKGRLPGGLHARDFEMEALEPYSAKNVDDMITFLRTKDPKMIANSVVIYRGFKVPWRFFMIYYNKSENSRDRNYRFRVLINSMRDNGISYMPVLMEVATKEGYPAHKLADKNWVFSKPFDIEDIDGDKEHVVPRIFINTTHPFVMTAFEQPIRGLVLGLAKVKKAPGGDILLDVSIQSPRQFRQANLVEISHDNRLNQQRRALEAQAPSSSGPDFS